jgi:hypothetical protein
MNPYNCAWNNSLSLAKPKWAAILLDSHYQPFLAKRFPRAHWLALSTADPAEYASHLLCVMPIEPENQKQFESWSETYHFLMSIDLQLLDRANGKSRIDILEEILNFYPKVPNDPFLQSVVLAKWMDMYSRLRFFHPSEMTIQYHQYESFLESAMTKGYPDPWLFISIARLMMAEGHWDKAQIIISWILKNDPHNEMALQLRKILSKGHP